MKYQKTFAAAGILLSSTVGAEEYQIFSEMNYIHREYRESYSLNGKYFFDAKTPLGPLNEFKYVNTVSFISADLNLNSPYDDKFASLTGEWIAGSVGLGGSVTYADNVFGSGYANSQVVAKYYFSDKIFAGVTYKDFDRGDSLTGAFASYEHSLVGDDYIGFTGSYEQSSADDAARNWNLQSKYYNDLKNGMYWVLTGSYSASRDDEDIFNSDVWLLGTRFYFTKFTSIGVNYAQIKNDAVFLDSDGNITEGSITHYFTQNFYASGGYSILKYDSSLIEDLETYYLTAGLQY